MLYPWLIPLLAAVALLLLAHLASRNGPRNELTETFIFLSVMFCFWNLNFFVLYSADDYEVAVTLSRTLRTGTLFLIPAILHLFVALNPARRFRWRWVLYLSYGVGGVLALLNSFDLLVGSLRHYEYGYASVAAPLYNLFTVFALANCATALWLLTFEYFTTSLPRTRQQLSFWGVAMFLGIPLALTNLLPAYGVPIYPPGNLGSVAWAGIVGYAIVRHRLMDIELAVSMGLSYLIALVLVAATSLALLIAAQRFSFGHANYDFTSVSLLLVLSVAMVFPIIRTRLERVFETSLFSEKRKARESLVQFGRSIIKMLDEKKVASELALTIASSLNLSNVLVYILEDGGQGCRRAVQTGPGDTSPEIDARWLTELSEPILRSEIETLGIAIPLRKQLAEVSERNEWEVVVPLGGGKRVLGFIGLGGKRNMQAYTAGDLEVLASLGSQASIAIENARLHDRLRRSQEIISRSDRLSALGTLAAGIAHEIRNPLVSIQTFFQLAPDRLDDDEFMNSFLPLADKELARIRTLIGDLLSYAKESEPRLEEVNLCRSIDKLTTLLSPHASELGIAIKVGSTTDLSPIQADHDQVLQALMNVVLNAIQASPAGGVVSIDGASRRIDERHYSVVVVRDAGPGIPTEQVEAIFNPFFTTKDSGTGLGLAITHRIVTDLGGFVEVETSRAGSVFSVCLPAIDDVGRELLVARA